jgi:hypothetical protein
MPATLIKTSNVNLADQTDFKCKYCDKGFRRESSLIAHLCEKKRRWQQQNEQGVQLGYNSYIQFYETTQGSARLKTYQDFVDSPFYLAFVRYGRYLVDIRAVNVNSFTAWLLKNNKKLDHWCKDSLYTEWLQAYLKKENPRDALERAIKEMQDYEEKLRLDGMDTLGDYSNYFRHGNTNRICHHIATGRISAWIVYNCDSGLGFLDNLGPEQVGLVMPYIDPDYWNRRFREYLADTEWARTILTQAGL